ncbi:hypothetical protein GCM10008967_03390 [Bacillus carboniphilus]|uniref:DUF4199 domain-containing protein n=1 Tax=Bacillus carboniphilus TaxID=86663 RepID=A0ABN0VSD2_9BACI
MNKTERSIDLFILVILLGIFIFTASYVLTGTENLFRLLSYVFFAFIFLLIGFLVAYLIFFRDSDQSNKVIAVNLRHVIYGTMTVILVVTFIKLINDTANYYDSQLHFIESGEIPEYLRAEGLRIQFMLFTAGIFALIFTLFGLWLTIKKEK